MDSYRTEIRRFVIALNRIDGMYYQIAKTFGVKDNFVYLLYALDDGKPHSQKQICDEWLIPRTTINTIVREYVQKGYITLLHTDHSREKRILLTDSGRKYAQQLLQKIYDAEESAMADTIAAFDNGFIAAVEQFADSLQHHVPGCTSKNQETEDDILHE
ncbi:MAG TPA: MarR family transcriptional regulator [Candidatus Onthovicinus excrementipullorum]|nr:MarR family transcriptional regulator [Candidatus Onthovicinus excrementipullorum]